MSQDVSAVSALGYLVFECTPEVLGAMEAVYGDVLGAGISKDGGAVAVRFDGRPFRIRMETGSENRLTAIGWEVPHDGFGDLAARLGAHGIALTQGTPELLDARLVDRLAHFTDGDGFRHEFHVDRPFAADPALDAKFVCGHEPNGEFGLGHIVQIVSSMAQTRDFYVDLLGFGVSDRITWPAADLFFFHCNQRHHTVALSEPALGLAPGAVHHLMFEAKSKEQVDRAYERLQQLGFPVIMTIGQHTNDEVYSFYMGVPAGFAIEFGYGGKVVDRATWEFAEYDAPSSWGHELQLMG